jgi:hypothetical protein
MGRNLCGSPGDHRSVVGLNIGHKHRMAGRGFVVLSGAGSSSAATGRSGLILGHADAMGRSTRPASPSDAVQLIGEGDKTKRLHRVSPRSETGARPVAPRADAPENAAYRENCVLRAALTRSPTLGPDKCKILRFYPV